MRKVLFLCCLLTSIGLAAQPQTNEFSIVIQGIPRSVMMNFPEGFSLADSEKAKQRRGRLLNFFRLNPAMRGQYDDILLRDWSSEERYPQIVVGTLGSTAGEQGNMSIRRWGDIRRAFLDLSSSSIERIRSDYRPRIEAGSPVTIETIDELIWLEEQTDPNAVVILAHMRSELQGASETTFSARKLLYHDGYLIFVNVYVDSSSAGALGTIRSFLDALNIVSI